MIATTTIEEIPLTTVSPARLIAGVPEDAYHALSHCSASVLKRLSVSTPLHVRAQLDSRSDTPALRLGRAVHCSVLEPSEFWNRYAVAPRCDRRTKAGKSTYAEFADDLGEGVTVLTHDEGEQVLAMTEAVSRHRAAAQGLDAASHREITVLGEMYGVACKARLDAMTPEGQWIFDLKTTRALASRQEMEREMHRHGYALQLAFYRAMARVAGAPVEACFVIAVEKAPPYGVAVFHVQDDVLDLHEPRIERLVHEWADTLGVGKAPGWSPRIQSIGLPDWARLDLELEAEQAAATTTTGGVA